MKHTIDHLLRQANTLENNAPTLVKTGVGTQVTADEWLAKAAEYRQAAEVLSQVQKEQDAVDTLQEVMGVINQLPIGSEEFLGEDTYRAVRSLLDGEDYVGRCDSCFELVPELNEDSGYCPGCTKEE